MASKNRRRRENRRCGRRLFFWYWLTPSQKAHCVSVSMFILITPALIAYWMSSVEEPEPPWKTKDTGLLLSQPSFSLMYFCVLCRISGCKDTLPGAYTPCTLPKAAATVNLPLGTEDNAW